MPNWVKNVIETDTKTLNDIMNKYSDKGVLTFHKIIPMPEELDIESSSNGKCGLIYLYLETNDEKRKSKLNEVFKSMSIFENIEDDGLYKNIIQNINERRKNKKDYNECISLANKYIDNYEKYGYVNWYEWCCDKWGTKWDLSEFTVCDDSIAFETAWDFPKSIVLKLSKEFPKSTFHCKFADELNPENSGIINIKNGKILDAKYHLSSDKIKDICHTRFYNPLQEENQNEIEI